MFVEKKEKNLTSKIILLAKITFVVKSYGLLKLCGLLIFEKKNGL